MGVWLVTWFLTNWYFVASSFSTYINSSTDNTTRQQTIQIRSVTSACALRLSNN